MNLLYVQQEWTVLRSLGDAIDRLRLAQDIQREKEDKSTFIDASIAALAGESALGPIGKTDALGEDKRRLAERLVHWLVHRLVNLYTCAEVLENYGLVTPLVAPGGMMHYGSENLYLGEPWPRWTIGYFWRADGLPIWCDPLLVANDRGLTNLASAREFIDLLAGLLGIATRFVMTAHAAGRAVGYVMPLVCTHEGKQTVWSSCEWSIYSSSTGLELSGMEEEAAIGLRLPLRRLPMVEALAVEQNEFQAAPLGFESMPLAVDSVRGALTVEVRCGTLYVFLPPIASDARFLSLVHRIELTASRLNLPVRLEGFLPPVGDRIRGFQIMPDVVGIEGYIHPAGSWQELLALNEILEQTTIEIGLTTTFSWDGRGLSTGCEGC